MCGFVTIVNAPGHAVSGSLLKEMTARLAHRGPDGSGYACVDPAGGACRTWGEDLPDAERLPGIVFGHRRLAIVDPTAAGHQPMVSDDRLHVLTYNGEVYNFPELRRELESRGVRFRGRSDTEVLLRAYEQWGAAAVERFNGMWAFTLWDGRRRTLVASRDRFGVKPLYYAVAGGAWVFASEVKALAPYPGAVRGPDEGKVAGFLTRCALDDDRDTMFKGVRALPPAAGLEVAPGEHPAAARPRPFWHLRVDGRHRRRPERELVEEFAWLLTDSVRLRVRSDVPTGTMLSGGLDSTSITLLIDELRRSGEAVDGPPGPAPGHQTFTACFPGWASDEEADARLLCDRVAVQSHLVRPTADATLKALPDVVYHLDEPFISPTAVVNYLLMREASACGVKVVINGHGSDEMLGGYPRHFVAPFLAGLLMSGRARAYAEQCRMFDVPASVTRRVVPREVVRAVVPQPLKRPLRHIAALLPGRRRGRDGVFEAAGHDPRPAGDGRAARDVAGKLSPLNAALWTQFGRTILPRWLRMEDRMSMAWSIESRLPFMDYRLVEFVFNLPDTAKLNDGQTKYILRRAMAGRLPDRIVQGTAKRCFGTPYPTWLRGAWRPMVEDLLLSGDCRVRPYLRLDEFRMRLRRYLDGSEDGFDAGTLWRVLSTELWLRTFAGTGRGSRSSS